MSMMSTRAGGRQLPLLATLLLALATLSCGAQPPLERSGPAQHLNLGAGELALGGYDPVAYFPNAGGQARQGSVDWTAQHNGATYRFVTAKNRDSFLIRPGHFTPAYGGWCAWAMADGQKVEVDPRSFLIQGDRLMVFFDGFFADTRKSWRKGDPEQLERVADLRWRQLAKSNLNAKAGEGER